MSEMLDPSRPGRLESPSQVSVNLHRILEYLRRMSQDTSKSGEIHLSPKMVANLAAAILSVAEYVDNAGRQAV